MENSCKDSRGYTMEKINCEKMKMTPLTAEENESYSNQSVTYPKRI